MQPPEQEPMRKLYDGRFDFPDPYALPSQAACWLRVYTEGRWKGVVAVATELAGNPGASVTNGIEELATAIRAGWMAGKAGGPVLFEHYCRSISGFGDGDFFSLVEFGIVSEDPTRPVPGARPRCSVAGPRWQWVPGSLVFRLVGEQFGDGRDRSVRRPGPDEEFEEEATAP
jgi:hypothetical protein